MKKKIIGMVMFLILNFLAVQPVLANSNMDAKLSTNRLEFKSDETVEVTFSFDNFKEVKKGINAYKGTLEYDKNIFEGIVQSDFVCQNNWESLKFNPKTGEFVAIRKTGTRIGGAVVKITLKAKSNIGPTKTTVKIKYISTSEGKKDIFLNDATVVLNVVKEQQEIPTEPNKPVQPNKPNQGGITINTSNPLDVLLGNKVEVDITENSSDDQNDNKDVIDDDQSETPDDANRPTVSPEQKPNETDEPVKVKKTTSKYIGLFLFILLQLILLIILYIRHKSKNKNRIMHLSLIFLGIIITEFVGTVCAFAYNFAQKGELNGDSKINYSDVSLLELHLIHLKSLEDDVLENADMNSDGKITITDLTILVQKIEKTLEYDVEIASFGPDNASPNKNQEVVITFDASVSYGASIEKLTINDIEYEVVKDPNTFLYTIKLKVGSDAKMEKYLISEALLDNGKTVTMDYSFKLDVLKDIPIIENYRVEENKDDSKLVLLFDVKDSDNSIDLAHLDIYDENQSLVTQEKVVVGKNRIEISVEEKKEYLANILLNYNLSNDSDTSGHKGVQSYEKQLQLLIDYNFTFSNVKSYKNGTETTIFSKGDQVKLVFESTNSTRHVPKTIKVNGKEYEVVEENNQFAVTLDALTDLGSQTIMIDEIVLSNGKKFELTQNNSITIQVNKRKPSIVDLTTMEFTETSQLRVMFHLDDLDKAVTNFKVQVLDANDQEIDHLEIARDEIDADGIVNKFFSTRMTTQYKINISMSYNVTENKADAVVDELAKKVIVEADPRIKVKNITPSSHYVEKGGVLKLTFDVESNKVEDITRILINNMDCIAVKLDNGNYEASFNVGMTSGIYPLEVTRFTYSNGAVATTDERINIDILKEKPEVIDFSQIDNLSSKEVILRFYVKDNENSFLNGKAILSGNGNSIEKVITKGYNELIFQVEPSKKYLLNIISTYDLDSNSLSGMPEEDNRVFDEVLSTKEIELITDYELNLDNIKTYNAQGETRYFEKSEPINVRFESTNKTAFEPIKVVINGVEYPVTKKDDTYHLTIDSHRTSGVKTGKIEKITLNNSKEIMITENNEFKVTILKDKPTVEQFGYKENMDATISASFKVMDEEQTITGGKVMITKNGNIVKEQSIEKGENTIIFQPEEDQNYVVKVIADYDLDMNVLEGDANEYKNIVLLEADITLGARKFEMKDIIRTSIYQQTDDGVVEVKELRESDLTNLSGYIAKVYMKQMPTFYTKITDYRIEDNQLKLTLDYDNVVQYAKDSKQDKLEIVYGTMNNGVAENVTLEALIREMEANPTGTFNLTRDYDASIITKNSNTLISSSFMGTLNGNGYKIYNLSKPLFDTIDSATVENLVLESSKLSGPNSKGTIANVATNSTIRNVHVHDLALFSGASQTAGLVGTANSSNIEQCSVVNFNITTSGHIRISAIVGQMDGGSIKNCYVEGEFHSTQNKDGNGMGGILGHAYGSVPVAIENCISKVKYENNVSHRLNGDIVGAISIPGTVLKNNVSLSTGRNFYSIYGLESNSDITNNYELANSGLTSNASGNRVKQVEKEELTTKFFQEEAQFDDSIWDLSNVSYDHPPILNSSKETNDTVEVEKPTNSKLYIPDFSRVKKINGYTEAKDILYHNIHKLMPYYDAKYLIEDGLKVANDHLLNTKIIKHVIPYSNGKMVTYLTSQNQDRITSVKVVFEDFSVQEYHVTFKELKRDISIYTLEELDLEYAYHNYVIKETASIVQMVTDYISNMNYAVTLDPLTAAADSRLYRDHYNEVMKPLAEVIALQLLQNDGNSVLTMDSEILNQKIKQELIDSGRLDKILYAYNYYHRWYQFEIGGSKISDILLFEGKMYKDSMTIDNLTEEVLTGNLGTNVTNTFYVNSIRKYTDSANLGLFLDNIIANIGGYQNINDWFTEYFATIGILSEIPVESHPEVKYRAWDRIKGFQNFILPLSTLPKHAGYIISGPAQFQVGAQRVYIDDPTTVSGQNTVKNIVNNHSKLVKRQFETLAGTFHVESWNNFTIMVYDTVKTITGYKTSYFPGTNIPIGISPITTINRTGTTTEPFHKNFNEAVGAWQYGSAAGVGNTAGFLWFIATAGLTNYDTWTHEYQHALADKIMMFRRGVRLPLEVYTQGNVEQRENWSNNNLDGYDVGPYYFNLAFTLGKESMSTQNLTPERINTKEKLENYYKGQMDALELLDYVSAKAFIKLTPEQQSKIATRMAQSGGWSTWRTITKEQAESMNLTTLESLWDNHIILRPNNAWGVSVRGLVPINSIGGNDYGYESIWVTRWYMGHNDGGSSDAFTSKKNLFEMLGYGGVNAYVTYGSGRSKNDLDAIQKITLEKTGTAMNWKEYRMSRYAEIESKLDNKYVNVDLMIEQFTSALTNDANNGNRNITSATNLRKVYYHYLKRVTNDFIDDPLGTTIKVTHIKTAEELVEKINEKPYGYYILDNDIDFSGMTRNVTQTFMGKLDGNGHKIIGNTIPIFQKIRYGYVKDLTFENTNIPITIANVGALSVRTEYSVLENVKAKGLQLNFGGRNDISLIGGTVATSISSGIAVETLKNKITSIDDFVKINENPGGIYVLEVDLDFASYTGNGSVITVPFTGKLDGKGHTVSNLNNLSLFSTITGTVEKLNIKDFTNIGSTSSDDISAFAKLTNGATLRSLKFENVTLEGRHRIAVVSSFDNANSTFENISVKNASVKGSGVYVSTFVGRKYGGTIKNVFVEGMLEITTTENGGIVGALQKGGTISNVISIVNIHKTGNTYTNVAESERNGGIVGNVYDNPMIKNSIALGNMEGFTNADGQEKIPYKVIGAEAAKILTSVENVYEYADSHGFSSITDETSSKIKEATEEQIHTNEFYRDALQFDDTIWNFDEIKKNGHPVLK